MLSGPWNGSLFISERSNSLSGGGAQGQSGEKWGLMAIRLQKRDRRLDHYIPDEEDWEVQSD